MAGSAVWLDVLPSMAKFGSTMSKQAGAAARTAGVTAGKQFSAGVAAGGSTTAAKTLVSQLEVASKRAARVIQTEKVAIAKARADEKAAAVGVQAAEARLAEQRKKYTAVSSQALKAEQQLAVARGRQQTTALKTVAVEDQLKAAFSEQKAVTGQLAAAQAQGSKQTALMQSRFGRLAAAGAPLSAGLGKVAQGAKNVAANAIATLKPLAGLAAGFGAIVGVSNVIKLGNEYTATMNELQAVAGLTNAQMVKVGATARALGSDLTLPATSGKDAAEIMLELAKGGLTAADAMRAAKGTIQLAAAAQVDGGRAAEIQANSLNQFGLAAKDASLVADVLANTANAAAGGVDDIALSLKYVGPVARAFGVDIQDTASSIGLLANQGLKGDTAGTALRGMLSSLSAPSKAASNALDDLGVVAFNSAGQFVGMRAIIKQLSKAQKELTKEQFTSAAATAFGREPLAAVVALSNEGAKGFDAMSKAVARQGGAAAVAQSKMKGLGGAMDKLQSQLEDVALGIYQTVTPALTGAVNGIAASLDGAGNKVQNFLDIAGGLGRLAITGKVSGDLTAATNLVPDSPQVKAILAARQIVVDAFNDIRTFVTAQLVPSLRNLAAALGPLAAVIAGTFVGALRAAGFILAHVIGPALVGVTGFMRDHKAVAVLLAAAVGGLVLAYKAYNLQMKVAAAGGALAYIKTLRVVQTATTLWAAAQWALNLALAANPFVLIGLAIAGLVAGVIYAYNNFTWFRNGVDAAWKGIVTAAQWAWNTILKPTFAWIAEAAQTVGGWFVWLWKTILQPVWIGIATVVRTYIAIVKAEIMAVVAVVKFIAAVFTWWWQNVVTPVFRGIAAVAGWFWNTFSAVVELVVAIVKFTLAPVFAVLATIAKASWTGIVTAVQWAWGILSATFNIVVGFLRGTLGVAFSWLYTAVIKPAWSGIVTAVQVAWTGLRIVFAAISSFLRSTLGPVFTWLYQNAIKPAWDGIKLAVMTVWGVLKPVFDRIASVAKTTIPAAFTVMKDGIAKAWEAVKNSVKAPIRFVVDTVINGALIGNFNKLATMFGTKKIAEISLPKGFAGGGVIPGYSSVKRDDHLRPMRAGEGVLVPEVVKALGPGFVHSLNAAGNSGGVSGVRKATGYAKGGIVGAGKDILSGAMDATRNVASLATGLVTDPAGTITNAVKALIGKIPGAGSAVDLAAGFGRKVLGGAVQALQNMIGSFLPSGGSGANGSIPGSQLGKATNYHPGSGVGAMGGYLRAPAAAAWNAMVAASGGQLTLTEGYRDLKSQQYRWAQYKAGRGNLAAAPGTSVHGFGLAADVGAGQGWARANGARFGWYPTGLSFSQREPWHFEYKGGSGAVAKAAGPTLYDKGGVIPRGTSLIQNNLRDPEVALPMRKLEDIVAGGSRGAGVTNHWNIQESKDTDGLVKEVTRRQNLGLV